MERQWTPQLGDKIRVKRDGFRGSVIGIEGSGDSTIYRVGPPDASELRDTYPPLGALTLGELEPDEGDENITEDPTEDTDLTEE